MTGLRERKKARTRAGIADAAMSLFAQRGFDDVTVAEVARKAEVSVATLFNYFPAKEDLFFDRQEEVVEHVAEVIRTRRDAESFAHACRRDMLELIATRDWRVGLTPAMASFHRIVQASPSLRARSRLLVDRSVARCAVAIAGDLGTADDDIVASSAAWVLVAIRTNLLAQAQRDSLDGIPLDENADRLTKATNRAFDLLDGALGSLGAGT